MTTEIKQLISGNKLYNDNYTRYKFLYDSYLGGETYRLGQYLTKYQLETENEYKSRLALTPLDNHCQSVISVFTSFLFREKPTREFGDILSTSVELQDFLNDADYEGRSFDSFMKEVSIWSQVFGHTWVMMSKPDINATTRADEIAMGVRPYASLLTPLVVLDWSWERLISGRYNLSYLKYVEDVNGSVRTIKEWTPEVIRTSTVDVQHETILNQTEEVNGLGQIPAVIAYDKRSIIRGIGISSINDIADIQRFIYNATSEVGDSIRLDSHPSLVKTEDTLAGVGAGAIIQIPENLDAGLKPYVLDFAGANIDNIYTAINNSIASIEKMANIGAVRATESKTVSGIALETEFQLLNSNLSEKADNLELAEEQIWRLYCLYMGVPYTVEIEYPGSFAVRDTDREIDQLQKMKNITTDPALLAVIDAKLADLLDVDDYAPFKVFPEYTESVDDSVDL